MGVEAPRDRAVAPTEVGLVVLTEEAEAPICNNPIAALVVALLPTGEDLFLEDLAVLVGSQGLVEDRLIIFVVLFCCFVVVVVCLFWGVRGRSQTHTKQNKQN